MIVLEISESQIKAVWGTTLLGQFQVQGISVKVLRTDIQYDLEDVLSSVISDKIYKRFKPLIMCVPRNEITVRNAKFPTSDKAELSGMIDIHLSQEVPFSRDDVICNFDVIDVDSAGFSNVLMVIIHRQRLIKSFTVLEKLNMYPDNIVIGSVGVVNLLAKSGLVKDQGKVRAYIDIGNQFTDFSVFRGGKILFSKSINVGIDQLATGGIARFIGEMKQAIIVYQPQAESSISNLYITGIKFKHVDLDESIRDIFRIPLDRVELQKIIPTLKSVPGIIEILDSHSIASLLGITSAPMTDYLNLEIPELRMRREAREMTRHIFITGILLIAGIITGLFYMLSGVYVKQSYLRLISGTQAQLEKKNETTLDAMGKIKELRNYREYKRSFLYYYYECSKLVPDSITVERVIFNKDKDFSLIGKGREMGDIFKFVRELNNCRVFGKVELRYSRKKSVENVEYNEFDLMCNLNQSVEP